MSYKIEKAFYGSPIKDHCYTIDDAERAYDNSLNFAILNVVRQINNAVSEGNIAARVYFPFPKEIITVSDMLSKAGYDVEDDMNNIITIRWGKK